MSQVFVITVGIHPPLAHNCTNTVHLGIKHSNCLIFVCGSFIYFWSLCITCTKYFYVSTFVPLCPLISHLLLLSSSQLLSFFVGAIIMPNFSFSSSSTKSSCTSATTMASSINAASTSPCCNCGDS